MGFPQRDDIMKQKPRFILIWQDIAVVGAIVADLFAHFFTNYIEGSIRALVQTANAVEANPVQKVVQTSFYVQFVLFGVIYAILLATYLYQRQFRKQQPYGKFILNVFTFLIFLIFMYDFMGDAGIFAAVLLK